MLQGHRGPKGAQPGGGGKLRIGDRGREQTHEAPHKFHFVSFSFAYNAAANIKDVREAATDFMCSTLKSWQSFIAHTQRCRRQKVAPIK